MCGRTVSEGSGQDRLGSGDRKSTRLNSSHTVISYAVFCLRTEKHTSELQSHSDLVCRLLLEKKRANVVCPVTQTYLIPSSASKQIRVDVMIGYFNRTLSVQ